MKFVFNSNDQEESGGGLFSKNKESEEQNKENDGSVPNFSKLFPSQKSNDGSNSSTGPAKSFSFMNVASSNEKSSPNPAEKPSGFALNFNISKESPKSPAVNSNNPQPMVIDDPPSPSIASVTASNKGGAKTQQSSNSQNTSNCPQATSHGPKGANSQDQAKPGFSSPSPAPANVITKPATQNVAVISRQKPLTIQQPNKDEEKSASTPKAVTQQSVHSGSAPQQPQPHSSYTPSPVGAVASSSSGSKIQSRNIISFHGKRDRNSDQNQPMEEERPAKKARVDNGEGSIPEQSVPQPNQASKQVPKQNRKEDKEIESVSKSSVNQMGKAYNQELDRMRITDEKAVDFKNVSNGLKNKLDEIVTKSSNLLENLKEMAVTINLQNNKLLMLHNPSLQQKLEELCEKYNYQVQTL